MNGIVNSRLRHPVTRLHRLIIILAVLAVVTLATAPVNAQQVVFNICDRTQEVQDAILGELTDSPTCSTVTETQLAGIKVPLHRRLQQRQHRPGRFCRPHRTDGAGDF